MFRSLSTLIRNNWVRFSLLGLIAIAGIVLGYIRWTYALIWDNGFRFIYRFTLYDHYRYPDNYQSLFKSILQDPRWLSLIFYSVCPFLLSLVAVYLTFLKKEYVKNTVIVYVLAWSLVIFLSIISLIFPTYAGGIGLAQNIKNLLQMPFFILLLLAGFKVSEIANPQQHNKAK